MALRLKRWIAVVILLGACEPKPADPPQPERPEAGTPESTVAANTCMPEGLESGKRLEVFALPSGCTWTAPGTLAAPARISGVEPLAAALSCDATANPPSFDFSTEDLELAQFSMSPAFAGVAIVDDGKTISFVMRQRSPCPDDPMPMPMASTLAYLIDKGAAREHRTLSCTLAPRCN
jgi:hypothetical protein